MATYYWVGGSGTWNNSNTANWSTSSGGAGGSGPPNNADTVNFDSNSGTAATVTVAATAAANTVIINKSDINLSLSANANLNGPSSGSLTLTAGILTLNSYTLTLRLLISSNTNARTINFGTGNIVLTANANTIWSCATVTNLTVLGTPVVNCTYSGSTGTRTISHGNSAGQSETNVVSFNFTAGTDTVSLTNVKNLDFTGFSGTLTNAGIRVYGSLKYSTGMTLTAGASQTIFNGTNGTYNITTNGKTLDFPLQFNGVNGIFSFQDSLNQGSSRAFTFVNGTIEFKNGVTNSTGVFTTSGSNTKILRSTSSGNQATLSQSSGTVNASYLIIKDINVTGGAIWNAFVENNNVDAGNNSGWDFFGPSLDAEYSFYLRSFTEPRRF